MRTLRHYQSWFIRAAAVVAVVFGVATIRAGGSVLFGDGAQAAGNVVGFVLWFNFLAGFAYVAAGAGLWLRRRWSAQLALTIAAATRAGVRRVRHPRGGRRRVRNAHGLGHDAAQRRMDPDRNIGVQIDKARRLGCGASADSRD